MSAKRSAEQRWDDHRYYHHSRINQSLSPGQRAQLHRRLRAPLREPAVAVLVAWLLAMPSRQLGHFFFEPKGYDEANQATHEYKEGVKVGYNLYRKSSCSRSGPCRRCCSCSIRRCSGCSSRHGLVRVRQQHLDRSGWSRRRRAWSFRTVHLFFLRDVQTGLVWCTKILTDPFHDVKLYHKAPIHVLRGELFDPIVPRTRREPPAYAHQTIGRRASRAASVA